MISCSLFFHDRHSQGELAAEGVFGASDLLSDLRCNGVHCWEQLWKRWKWSATHKGRRVGRTGFILADIYLWTQTDITFDRQNGPWFPTQTVFSITHTFLSESSCQYPSFSPCLRIMLKGMIVLITDLLWHLLCALSYGATNAYTVVTQQMQNLSPCRLSVLQLHPPNMTGKAWQVSHINLSE